VSALVGLSAGWLNVIWKHHDTILTLCLRHRCLVNYFTRHHNIDRFLCQISTDLLLEQSKMRECAAPGRARKRKYTLLESLREHRWDA
jgi:hypothetical protein